MTDFDDRDPVDLPLAAGLPDPAVVALREWAIQSGLAYELSRWYTNGKSSAVVCAVLEHDRFGDSRKVILKLDRIPDAAVPGEYVQQKLALSSNTTFAVAHLVQPVRTPVRVDSALWFTFQELATGPATEYGLTQMDVLTTLLARVRDKDAPYDVPASSAEAFAATCGEVVRAVLTDWPVRTTTRVPVPTFLGWYLQRRLEPGGDLHKLAAALTGDHIGVDSEPGRLPNPFALLRDDGRTVQAQIGFAHGDLHTENVLIPVRPVTDATGFRLIDLARFRSTAPLARDPYHLLLYIVARSLGDLTDEAERSALIDLLLDPSSAAPSPVRDWLRLLVRRIHAVGEACAGSLLDEWRDQAPLSLMACALIFVGRASTADADRGWFLRLAARVAEKYRDEPRSLDDAPAPVRWDAAEPAGVAAPGSGRNWVATLCQNLPELEPAATAAGMSGRLTRLITAAATGRDPARDQESAQLLEQLMWELEFDSVRHWVPGSSDGRPLLGEAYHCPLNACPRTDERTPGGPQPRCNIAGQRMRQHIG